MTEINLNSVFGLLKRIAYEFEKREKYNKIKRAELFWLWMIFDEIGNVNNVRKRVSLLSWDL